MVVGLLQMFTLLSADETLLRFPKSSQPSDLTGISSLVSDEVF